MAASGCRDFFRDFFENRNFLRLCGSSSVPPGFSRRFTGFPQVVDGEVDFAAYYDAKRNEQCESE